MVQRIKRASFLMGKVKKAHIIGIGGIGMSAIAQAYNDMGYAVQGSDLNHNNNTESLKNKGIEVFKRHNATNIENADFIVHSSAIGSENAEIQGAIKKDIPIFDRKEALAQILNEGVVKKQKPILITGSHGKTTTTSLIAHILNEAGCTPLILSGGIIKNIDSNYKYGAGDYSVIEADESDGTMSNLPIYGGVITNLSHEHLDYYGSYKSLEREVQRFIDNIPDDGFIVVNNDAEELKGFDYGNKRKITFGINNHAEIRAQNITNNKNGVYFEIKGVSEGFEIPLYGKYNVYNAIASIAVARHLGIAIDDIKNALRVFKGVGRRFDKIGEFKGIKVFEDYAHHPKEIMNLLDSAKEVASSNGGEIYSVIQPHRYSRVRACMEGFIELIQKGQNLYITDIYSANEKNTYNISSESLIEKHSVSSSECKYLPSKELENNVFLKKICQILKPNDIILFIGAGNISVYAKRFADNLENNGIN